MGWEGYTADYPDGETMVQFLHSRSIGGGWNHPMFGHAAYDRAVDALRKSADAAQRTQLLRQIDAIVRDEVPLVPVYQTMIVRVTQPWVSNYRPRTFGSWLEYVNVDANKKKAR